MTHARQRLGRQGEDLACAALQRRGYSILARAHRSRFGEIDIVAKDGSTLVFVEVKTRDGATHGDPAEAVTPDKQRRVVAMAEDYLARHGGLDQACRFDVVAVDTSQAPPKVTVYPDAFRPGW
jgi:putative endonuclease